MMLDWMRRQDVAYPDFNRRDRVPLHRMRHRHLAFSTMLHDIALEQRLRLADMTNGW
jgi:hypothetical protein